MSRDRCRQFIAAASWFEGAPDDALDRLADAAIIRNYAANSYVWSLGESNTEVFGVMSGRVRISVSSAMGHEFAIIDREQGAWLGEPCLVTDEGRVLDARVLTPAEILAIPRQVVLDVAEDWPLMYRNLFRHNVFNNRGLYEIVAGMMFYPLRVRVAGRLLYLIEEHGQEIDGGILIDIKISQNDFARLALGSRQRVNRIFRKWTAQGLIETRDDHIFIKDVAGLEREMEVEE